MNIIRIVNLYDIHYFTAIYYMERLLRISKVKENFTVLTYSMWKKQIRK